MPKMYELIDNAALHLSEKHNGQVWFSNFAKKTSR